MKIAAIFLLAFIATAIADSPTQISSNNIGDIVTVGVNANLSVSNEQNLNIISIIAAILNQQALIVTPAEQLPAVVKPEEVSPFDNFAKMFQQN